MMDLTRTQHFSSTLGVSLSKQVGDVTSNSCESDGSKSLHRSIPFSWACPVRGHLRHMKKVIKYGCC